MQELFGDHLEGNTIIMFHQKHEDSKSPGNMIIWGNGADYTGLDSDDCCSYVNLSKLFKEFDYVKALPGPYK